MSQRKPVIIIDVDGLGGEADLPKTDEELAIELQKQENERFYTNLEELIDDNSNSEFKADGDLIEELDHEPFPGKLIIYIYYINITLFAYITAKIILFFHENITFQCFM